MFDALLIPSFLLGFLVGAAFVIGLIFYSHWRTNRYVNSKNFWVDKNA